GREEEHHDEQEGREDGESTIVGPEPRQGGHRRLHGTRGGSTTNQAERPPLVTKVWLSGAAFSAPETTGTKTRTAMSILRVHPPVGPRLATVTRRSPAVAAPHASVMVIIMIMTIVVIVMIVTGQHQRIRDEPPDVVANGAS